MDKKIQRAIKLLQAAEKIARDNGSDLEICYSGGKDSDVILELAKMAGIKYRAIYKCTTIDPKGTIKHAKDAGCEILRPKRTFAKIMEDAGMPSRFSRFCCKELKEYKVLDYAVLGIRRDESNKRSARYKEPEMCRVYSKKEKVRQYYPILDWTQDDVARFVAERNIKCHPLYYDDMGIFHPERRLGCMCCPLASRRMRIKEFKDKPNMVKLYIRSVARWLEKHNKTKTAKRFDNPYSLFVASVFFDNQYDYESASGLFGKINEKKYLEDFFGIKFNEDTWRMRK